MIRQEKIEIEVNSVDRLSRVTAYSFTITVNKKQVDMFVEVLTSKITKAKVTSISPALSSAKAWGEINTDEQLAINEEINKYFTE